MNMKTQILHVTLLNRQMQSPSSKIVKSYNLTRIEKKINYFVKISNERQTWSLKNNTNQHAPKTRSRVLQLIKINQMAIKYNLLVNFSKMFNLLT